MGPRRKSVVTNVRGVMRNIILPLLLVGISLILPLGCMESAAAPTTAPATTRIDQKAWPNATATQVADPVAEKMRGWIGDYVRGYLRNTYGDNSAWTTLEWGPVERSDNGNLSMRYKYETGNGKKTPTYMLFTFTPEGKWVSTRTMDGLQGLLGDAATMATVTSRVDKEGHLNLDEARTATLSDVPSIARLARFFPDAGTSITGPKDKSWLAAVEINFTRRSGRVRVVVNPELTAWSEGAGDFAVAGDLGKELAGISWDQPAATAATAKAPEEPWGDPVGGIQLRLHPVNSLWNVKDLEVRKFAPGVTAFAENNPHLTYDIRNVGNHSQDLGANYQFLFLEVDGKLYTSTLISGLTGSSPPGSGYTNASIPLSGWASFPDYKQALILTPRKHTIRVAKTASFFTLTLTRTPASSPASNPGTQAPSANLAFSNPVTIEILPDTAASAPSAKPPAFPASAPAAATQAAATTDRPFSLTGDKVDELLRASTPVRVTTDAREAYILSGPGPRYYVYKHTVEVTLDDARLLAKGLNSDDVRRALEAKKLRMVIADVQAAHTALLLERPYVEPSIGELESLVIKTKDGVAVKLSEVGTLKETVDTSSPTPFGTPGVGVAPAESSPPPTTAPAPNK